MTFPATITHFARKRVCISVVDIRGVRSTRRNAQSPFLFFSVCSQTQTSKTWSKKRFALFAKSLQGIQRLEEVLPDDRDPRKIIIPLNECVKIWTPSSSMIEVSFAPKARTQTRQADTKFETVFYPPCDSCLCKQIVTRDGTEHSLKVNGGDDETTDWLFHLQKVAFNIMEEKEEENQLYSGFDEEETLFRVKVIASPVKTLLTANAEYLLQLAPDSIVLLPFPSHDGNPIFIWSLRDIRRYGSSAETFTLEAGRRCSSGPGLFSFSTPKGTYLFSLLSSFLRDLMQKDQAMKGAKLEARAKPMKPPRKLKSGGAEEGTCLSLTPPPSPSNLACGNQTGRSSSPSTSDDFSPEYENILTLNVPSAPVHVTGPSLLVSTLQNTPHYLQNEVEYAVVLKEKRK